MLKHNFVFHFKTKSNYCISRWIQQMQLISYCKVRLINLWLFKLSASCLKKQYRTCQQMSAVSWLQLKFKPASNYLFNPEQIIFFWNYLFDKKKIGIILLTSYTIEQKFKRKLSLWPIWAWMVISKLLEWASYAVRTWFEGIL